MREPTERTPVAMPAPGLRLRVLYAAWCSCADWQTRGQLVRVALAQLARRAQRPRH